MNTYIRLNRDEYLNEIEAEFHHEEVDYEYRLYLKRRAQRKWEELMDECLPIIIKEYEDNIPV